MEERACVFVDGENLRYSLIGLLANHTQFQAADYLPTAARWADFFDWIVSAATEDRCRRLRTYWYSTESIDCFPHALDRLENQRSSAWLKRTLTRQRRYQERIRGLQGNALAAELQKIVSHFKKVQQQIELRFNHWMTVQNGIALRQRAIEFRRAGTIRFNLYEEQFGREKAVDVRLACDMVMLRDTYDTAIIVSGDQDYVPAAQILKDAGKTVVNVAFQKRNDSLLPGGARRLNIVTDASISVPYDVLKTYMGLNAANSAAAQAAANSAAAQAAGLAA